MKHPILPLATALALGLSAGAALADERGIQLTSETEAQIRTTLTEQGYEVRKVQTEDGMYEAYALKDGQKYEIYMDDQLQIVNVKQN